jgi:hypothetical protein
MMPDPRESEVRTPPETTARGHLRTVAADLETIRFRLLGVQSTLPEPAAEKVQHLDVDSLDIGAELHTRIGCVLEDRLLPAIRDLQTAAAEAEAGGG